MRKLSLLLALFLIVFISCTEQPVEEKTEVISNPGAIHATIENLTEAVVYDVFSPPVAARVYVYPNIAAYEVLASFDSDITSFAGRLNGLGEAPKPSAEKEYSEEVAAINAFVQTSKHGVFSEDIVQNFLDSLNQDYLSKGISRELLNSSIEYGEAVAKHIVSWAEKDMYKESRSFPKYTPIKSDTAYALTPPDFKDAMEPHWNQIRTMVMDSASQFMPVRPYKFSKDTSSAFYKSVKYVYDISKTMNQDQKEMATFWDNNPYIMEHHGHMMIGVKKVSPAGHWLGIAEMACKEKNATFKQSVMTYAYTSIAFFEAFISAFDEKYRSEYIRPETFINIHIDPDWKPLLQTPPFPEYTSAHSVTSASAATILTQLYGDNYSFTDSVEVPFGQSPREQPSFLDAAQEASMSRLYGGIHYLPSLDNGNLQGRLLGKFIIEELEIPQLGK